MISKSDRKCFDGLTTVNVELPRRCNKAADFTRSAVSTVSC